MLVSNTLPELFIELVKVSVEYSLQGRVLKSNNMGRMKEVFERDRELTKHLKVDMFSYEEMKHYFKSIGDIYSGKLKTEDEAK